MSLRSSIQPPLRYIREERSVPAVNRIRQVGTVTCPRYRWPCRWQILLRWTTQSELCYIFCDNLIHFSLLVLTDLGYTYGSLITSSTTACREKPVYVVRGGRLVKVIDWSRTILSMASPFSLRYFTKYSKYHKMITLLQIPNLKEPKKWLAQIQYLRGY